MAAAVAAANEVISFYSYTSIADPQAHAAWQRETGAQLALHGRVIVATEGVSGTASGSIAATERYAADLAAALGLDKLDVKRAPVEGAPFPDFYVKVAAEIVSTGLPCTVDGSARHASPAAFRAAAASGDALILDVRNGFEHDVGHFAGAERAPIRTMQEWKAYVDASDVVGRSRGRPVLMYCTGGVRCEKASAYLRSRGVGDVQQLDGGIHRFLEQFPDGGGVWRGRNFLFDNREAENYKDGASNVVGSCGDCGRRWGAHDGRNVCSVCETLCLVCRDCRETRHEHYCPEHEDLRGAYCWFLDACDAAAIDKQADALRAALEAPRARGSVNRRRSLRKQLDRVAARKAALVAGADIYVGPPRCRSCGSVECEGRCWGFWKTA